MNFRFLGPPGDGKVRRCQSDRSQKIGLSGIFQPLPGRVYVNLLEGNMGNRNND